MITGKNVGTVIIDFHIPDNEPHILPPGELERELRKNLAEELEELIRDELGDVSDITVNIQEFHLADPRAGKADGTAGKGGE